MMAFTTLTSCDLKLDTDYYDHAVTLIENNKREEAILMLDKAIAANPKFRLALIKRGWNKAIWLDNYEDGIADFKKLLTFDPDNTLALYYIGYVYGDQFQHEKAIEYLSKALETEGALKENKIQVKLLLNTDYDKEALFTVKASFIYYERGLQYVRLGEFDKAIADLNKSILEKTNQKDSYFLLGETYLGKKDTVNACVNFKEASKRGDQEAVEMLTKYCSKANE